MSSNETRLTPGHRMYQQDPNNDKKQEPSSLNGNVVFSKATTPSPLKTQPNPHHIFINNTGSYHFNYESTSSVLYGDDSLSHYVQGMVIKQTNGLPVRLDIQPVAWSGSGFLSGENSPSAGDVTFVYRGQ